MDDARVTEALARAEVRMDAIEQRMGKLEKLTESVNSLALSLERLTAKQTAVETRLVSLTDDVNALKARPVKAWETLITAVISALVGAGITLLIS